MIGKNFGKFLGLSACASALPQLEKQNCSALQVHAHRGGAGLRPESTLYAFAYAMDIGADVVEMDTVSKNPRFTGEGRFGLTMDSSSPRMKSRTELAHVLLQYIVNLTLAEIKTLECGSQQSEGHTQAETFPGAKIQTLEEVLEFFKCYGDGKIEINLEVQNRQTKLDIRYPNETLPIEHYVNRIVPIIKDYDMLDRVYIQSFDWRSIVGIKTKYPETRVNALIDESLVDIVEATFGTDWVTAASFIGAQAICPGHGSPFGNGDEGFTINTPNYIPFTTKEMVERAHDLGMKLIVWTVDDESTIEKVILDGVDGVISNYPVRVGYVARELGYDVKVGRKGLNRAEYTGKCFKGASHYSY
ncbi:PLC-like phosphodiesterase [Geopyxis carbonaria]|nr:PLC-like phosphodiesterase [Geopyxis carbonaria]